MTHPVLPGAEAWSAPGRPDAAGRVPGVLVLHGFTSNPVSVRGLAAAFAAAGFAVELPRLPGHGTHMDDLLGTTWDDWSAEAERAHAALAARANPVVVAGLSMGGTLSAWLATRHPEIAGLVLVNPAIEAPEPSLDDVIRDALARGIDVSPGEGSDVADPEAPVSAYPGTPLAPALTLFAAQRDLVPHLGEIRCPVLLVTSRHDHVVAPTSSDVVAETVAGPVERVFLDRSFHVATIDFDKDEIEARAVEFARKVTAG